MFRPLLPVGYTTAVEAYQAAAAGLNAAHLTTHYTSGLEYFHRVFTPQLKQSLCELTGGQWRLDDYVAFAAGSDVDFMTHVVEAVAARDQVTLFPGDWFGFRVGCSQTGRILWDAEGGGGLACLCIPSVRNGHVTQPMLDFLAASQACLLNLNLFPTMSAEDRQNVARDLSPLLPKSVLSISFSRGFGLTASQLGVALVHRNHPLVQQFSQQWNWFTYFYNKLAADAFLHFDLSASQQVDRLRSTWVHRWLEERGLPVVTSGSYYVKSFRVQGDLPGYFDPLKRDNIIRLCFKPPQV